MNSRILLLAPAKASQHSMQEKLCSAITKSLVEQEVLRFEIGPGAEQASLEPEKTTLNHAIESIGNAAIEKGRKENCSIVLALIASPMVLLVAYNVASKLKAKLIPIFLETSNKLLANKLLCEQYHSLLANEYKHLVRNSTKLGTTSPAIARDIQSQTKTSCSVITSHLPWQAVNTWSPPAVADCYRITVLVRNYNNGSTLAAFLRALTWLTWQESSPPLDLQIIGESFDLPLSFNTSKKLTFEITGSIPIEQTISRMSRSNLCYFPIPLERELSSIEALEATDAFGLHVAAGVPILLHCPETFQPVEYVNRFNIGKCYHANEPGQLMELLQSEIASHTDSARLAQSYKNLELFESEQQQLRKDLLNLVS